MKVTSRLNSGGESFRSEVVVCNCTLRADNGGILPSGNFLVQHLSILFRPHQKRIPATASGIYAHRAGAIPD